MVLSSKCMIVFTSADVDECTLGAHGCSQTCTNTVGGYNCSCIDGFSLNDDGEICKGEEK